MTAATERPLRAAPDEPQDPNDINAERAVLGAALLKPDLIPELAGILRDDDWYRPAHELIWHTITDLAAGGQPVDEITVHDQLLRANHLQRVGGVLYLHQIVEDTLDVHAATYHARIIAERAQQRRTRELGTWLTQAAHTADPDTIRNRIDTHLNDRNPAQRATTSSWAPIDMTAVLDGTLDAAEPTLLPRSDGNHLIYPGAIHLLSGEPESGKTWIALHAVRHELAAGNNVAYLDFEDRAHRLAGRLLRIGAHPDHLRRHLRYIRPETPLDATSHTALTAAVTDTTLTVIDGMTEAMSMHGLNLIDNREIATFYALLPRRIASAGPAVILIDHVVKDPEKQGRWGIGGQHKLAGIDGAAYTVKCTEPFGPGRKGTARLTLAKDRHGKIQEHALGRIAGEFHLDSTNPDISTAQLDPAEAIPTNSGGELRPTVLMERVSRWLELRPGETVNHIKAEVRGKDRYVTDALRALIAEGYVEATDGPRGAAHHTVIEPFRQDQENQ